MKEEHTRTIDHDGNWKQLIHNLPFDFFAFFLPEIYPDIDKNTKPVFIDKEFHKLVKDFLKSGVTIKDKLVKAKYLNGDDCWCVIHIEVQSSFETDFAKRMYRYFIRLFDRDYKNIAAIAIYTNDDIPQNYKTFEFVQPYAKVIYEFGVYKVNDADEEELLKSSNPFALAVLACKYINKSKGNNDLRLQFKRKLFKLALERNYSKEQIGYLIKFIEFMLVLPNDIERQLKHEFLLTHGKMASTTPILPKDYDYPLPDFIHRLVHGIGIDERIEKAAEKARKRAQKEAERAQKEAERAQKETERAQKETERAQKETEKARKAEEKLQLVKANQISSIKKLIALGFTVEQISEILSLPVDEVRSVL